MRYISTLNVWDKSIIDAILSGQIKLQVGQWVTCGSNNDHKSRYVSNSKLSIWLVHWQGTGKATTDKFMRSIKPRGNV
jgi:hypothetical protein